MTALTWVTATPPTPNGDLHLGHMAGPYVAADVLRRYLAAEGTAVLMTTGMDDHQSYVPLQGLRSRQTAEQVADRYGLRIAEVWHDAGVLFDRIVEPRRTPGYAEFVQAFCHKLYDLGVLVPRTRPLPFCRSCDRWLCEAFVRGACPHCGESSDGNACEACARPNYCGDLGDPVCVTCGKNAQLRDQTRLFLPLQPFADRLARFWDTVSMPPRLRALCEAMAADGLPEIAVSHPTDWGIPVPAPMGFEGQRIYVWFEMAPGYLLEFEPGVAQPQPGAAQDSAVPGPSGEAPAARPTSGPVQFFGFDNGYFHAVLFPALFIAWDPDLPLPAAFVVNEFYRYEGKKFSTSRRHAVWARDALHAGSDAVRLQVMRDRPNGRQTNFTGGDLERARDHLHKEWNGWLTRLLKSLDAETDGLAPPEQPGGEGWQVLNARMTRLAGELRDAYSLPGFDPRRAADLLDEVVRCARDFGYVHEYEPRPQVRRAALSAQLAVASALAAWAGPALPAGARRLSAVLGLPPGRPVDASALAPVPTGSRLRLPAGPIFAS